MSHVTLITLDSGPFVFVADGPTSGRIVDFDPAKEELELQKFTFDGDGDSAPAKA